MSPYNLIGQRFAASQRTYLVLTVTHIAIRSLKLAFVLKYIEKLLNVVCLILLLLSLCDRILMPQILTDETGTNTCCTCKRKLHSFHSYNPEFVFLPCFFLSLFFLLVEGGCGCGCVCVWREGGVNAMYVFLF